MRAYLPILVLAVLHSAKAQNCAYVPDKNASSGACYVIPFGSFKTDDTKWSNQKYQTLIPSSALPNASLTIRDLGFAACTDGMREFASIRVRMWQTQRPALSTMFEENLRNSKVATVLDARDYSWPVSADAWSRIGLQHSFPFDPKLGNLGVEIEVRGAGAPKLSGLAGFHDSNLPRIYAAGWTSKPPDSGKESQQAGLRMALCFAGAMVDVFGHSCQGSSATLAKLDYSGLPRLASSLAIVLEGASAKARFAVLTFGLTSQHPFPIALDNLGAKGCTLYHSFDLAAGVIPKDGSASITVVIPRSAVLVGQRIYTQFVLDDREANSLGLTTTNYARLLVGN